MRFSDLDGKTVGVWGLGRETRSFARQLTERLPRARLTVVVREDLSESASEPWLGGRGDRRPRGCRSPP